MLKKYIETGWKEPEPLFLDNGDASREHTQHTAYALKPALSHDVTDHFGWEGEILDLRDRPGVAADLDIDLLKERYEWTTQMLSSLFDTKKEKTLMLARA
jgi:hypothetical protein